MDNQMRRALGILSLLVVPAVYVASEALAHQPFVTVRPEMTIWEKLPGLPAWYVNFVFALLAVSLIHKLTMVVGLNLRVVNVFAALCWVPLFFLVCPMLAMVVMVSESVQYFVSHMIFVLTTVTSWFVTDAYDLLLVWKSPAVDPQP